MIIDEKIATSLNNAFFSNIRILAFFCRFTVHIAYKTGSKTKMPEKRTISQYH